MFENCKENGGFSTKLVATRVIGEYIVHIRPLLNPQCEYVLVSRNGTQFKQLNNLMSELVFLAIGKYVHPTRYHQIVETESSQKLSAEEQDIVSRDQKHSSQVARKYYQKRCSREIATNAKLAMKKLQNNDVDRELKRAVFTTDEESESEDNSKNNEERRIESITSYQPPVRQASKCKTRPVVSGRVPFTSEEDKYLRKCLRIYGFGKWTSMLRDPQFKFHHKRTADSLKKRAEIISRKLKL